MLANDLLLGSRDEKRIGRTPKNSGWLSTCLRNVSDTHRLMSLRTHHESLRRDRAIASAPALLFFCFALLGTARPAPAQFPRFPGFGRSNETPAKTPENQRPPATRQNNQQPPPPGNAERAQAAPRVAARTPELAPRKENNNIEDLDLDPDLSEEEKINIRVYETTNRGVVNITTHATRETLIFLEVPQDGAGSGSIIDQKGHILTNWHVVEGAQQIKVTLFNGDTLDATVVGSDPPNDIAVLKIEASPEVLFPINGGDSSKLRVGQHIFAIGNPFGLDRTLTRGIISSLNRQLPSKSGRTMRSIIQVDAALNRGNSGGPLLDSRGRLIGMNTAIASSTGENTGVGFAIPVNTIRRVVPQLIRDGKVVRASIGITHVFHNDEGVAIVKMATNGPAERAGLRGFRIVKQSKRRGPFTFEEKTLDRAHADVIVGVDGKGVKTRDELLDAIEDHRPGDEIELTILREGQPQNMRMQLGADE